MGERMSVMGSWWLIGAAAVVASGVGCSSGSSSAAGSGNGGSPSTAGKASLDLNAPRGKLGGDCTTDSDCGAGLKCLTPAGYAHGTKYCASTCNAPSDCAAFANTSYAIPVPAQSSDGPNAWGTTMLERGVICDVSQDVGGTQQYCQFICEENAALASGSPPSCYCLPRYEWVMDAAGNKTSCQWSEASVCSIVNYPGRPDICDACNSQPLVPGCYTGDYRCAMNLNFNGTCYQWIDNPSECLTSATQDCDETCTENCLNAAASSFSSDADNCAALCCKANGRPASTPPTCAMGAPAMSGGAGGVSSTGGAPNGGASAGTSSGASTGTSSGGADARDAGAGGATGAGAAAADAGANKGGASAAGDGQGGGGGGGFGI